MWRSQVAAFKDGYRIIVRDMRGHGESDYPDNPSLYSAAHTVADMAAVLDECGVVVGVDDTPFLAAADLMVATISGSEKAVVAKAGHWSNIDNPNEFSAAVGAFLARVAR